MTPEQGTILATAIKTSGNATVIAALAIRDDVTLTDWLNTNSAQGAWNTNVSGNELFESTNVTKFDNLTAGKRDAWRLLLDFAPINFTKVKFRNSVVDVWGAVDSVALLQAATRKATRAENIFGGVSATTNSVTALNLSWIGTLSVNEVSRALNLNP